MGTLYYGVGTEAEAVPDRLLAHLKVVITTKLRRSESFTVSWRTETSRTTLWMHPAIPIRFVFDTAESEALNSAVLKKMAQDAHSSGGLQVDLDATIPASSGTAPAVIRPIRERAA